MRDGTGPEHRKESCGKAMIGLYGAATICARPKEPLHVHDPVWDWRDWEAKDD